MIGALVLRELRLGAVGGAMFLPLVFFLLCLPAFFLTDVVLLTGVFLLLRRKIGLLSLVGRIVACVIRYVLLRLSGRCFVC